MKWPGIRSYPMGRDDFARSSEVWLNFARGPGSIRSNS